MMPLLALSGSLRAVSYNTAALLALQHLVPATAPLSLFQGMDRLPHFNPDLETEPLPAPVAQLRQQVAAARGLIIACPEYAHGIPGSFKNLLDWLVGGPEFVGKPVMLINCSPRASDAQQALRNVISTMSGRLVDACCISLPLLGSGYGVADILANPAMRDALTAALDKFIATP